MMSVFKGVMCAIFKLQTKLQLLTTKTRYESVVDDEEEADATTADDDVPGTGHSK